jgi:hypothetical protein
MQSMLSILHLAAESGFEFSSPFRHKRPSRSRHNWGQRKIKRASRISESIEQDRHWSQQPIPCARRDCKVAAWIPLLAKSKIPRASEGGGKRRSEPPIVPLRKGDEEPRAAHFWHPVNRHCDHRARWVWFDLGGGWSLRAPLVRAKQSQQFARDRDCHAPFGRSQRQ